MKLFTKLILAVSIALSGGAAYAQTPPPVSIAGKTWTYCGLENGNCTWSGGGSRSAIFLALPPDTLTQGNEITAAPITTGKGCYQGGAFNTDPAPGYDKYCATASSSPPPAPTDTLTATPSSGTAGFASTLAWTSTNATSCSGVGTGLNGSTVVHPTVTTVYTQTCTGATSPAAVAHATATVTGSPPPPPTASLTASPTSGPAGTSFTLTLTSTNATSCTGPVSGIAGSVVVAPTSTTSYTETCSGAGSPPASSTATVTITGGTGQTLSFGSPSTVTGGTPNGKIAADTVTTDGMRIYANGASVQMKFIANVTSADTIIWSVQDALGAVKASGSFPVPSGVSTTTLTSGSSTLAGYFVITATAQAGGGTLPTKGTRPAGIATFGVLPATNILPAVTFANPDQHRIGMQGCNSNFACLQDLGAISTIDDDNQSSLDPNCTGYTASASHLNAFYQAHPSITRIARLDGYPPCNSITGQMDDSYNLPLNLTQWSNYVVQVAKEQALIHSAFYATQVSIYYQVTWEPANPGRGEFSNGAGAADFLTLYRTAYTAIHANDPNAVVMGPAEPFPYNNNTASDYRITNTPGLCAYIDGVTTHGYYDGGTYPAHPPERNDGDPIAYLNALDNSMRGLRGVMQTCKPNMKLFATELGINYDDGIAYASAGITANQLYAQGAVALRSHITTLGEGAQMTYYFFGPDFAGETGYGTLFALDAPAGDGGSLNNSPKPAAMMLAAHSRIIDGTQTLGYLNLPACVQSSGCVHGYAFQQLGGGKVITAVWFHKNSAWVSGNYSSTVSTSYTLAVDSPGTSGNVTVLDMFGNPTTKPYTNGSIVLTLTESPQYVVSANATLTKTLVTVPVGYVSQ